MGNRFEYWAKIILYVFAALLPIFFLPWPIGVELGREIVFTALLILAAIFWFFSILTRGEIRWQQPLIFLLAGGWLLVTAFSAFFSKAPGLSWIFAEPTAEKLLTLVLGITLMVLTGNVFRSRAEAGVLVFILFLSAGVSALINLVQILSGIPLYQFLTFFPTGPDFNPFATLNGAAILYGVFFIAGSGFLVFSRRGWKIPLHFAVAFATPIFLANLLVINFRTAWIVILGSGFFLFGLMVKEKLRRSTIPNLRYAAAVAIVVLSLAMIFIRAPLISLQNLPAEISPSFSATWKVMAGTFREGVKSILLGSGPGAFGLQWNLYKDLSINQTVFWGIRFNQGFSWISTLGVTTGILGVLAILAFLGTSLLIFIKGLLFPPEEREEAEGIALFLGYTGLIIAAFMYPANFTLTMLLFLTVGTLLSILSEPVRESLSEPAALTGGTNGWTQIRERGIRFETPSAVFVSSLVIIFFLSLGVAGLYGSQNRLRAAFARLGGVSAAERVAWDEALEKLERAARIEGKNFRHHQMLALVRIEKIRGLIQRAAGGENLEQEFQTEVSLAIQNSQRSVELHTHEPNLWRTQGALYELVIPFIQGAERLAFSSYGRAIEFDPRNPAVYLDRGRAGLIFADRLALAAGQAAAKDREEILKTRTSILEEAVRDFDKSIELKSDFAPAHFLKAQSAIRLGNVRSAIQSTENARAAAPFDIGIAFQLGILYYQSDDLARARQEFERALSLNSNYSNARYFLGLIYDRQGERGRAIEEFEKIQALNPDNEEVGKILSNLRARKSALSGIVPPAEPPEERKEVPVRERGR